MQKIVIFGVGTKGTKCIQEYIERGIKKESLILTDSNELLQNTEFMGMKIYNPENVNWKNCDVIIITTNSRRSREEIYSKLKILKVEDEKIVFTEDILVFPFEEYNIGNILFKEDVKKLEPQIILTKNLITYLEQNSMTDLAKYYFFNEHRYMTKWLHYFEVYDRFFSKYRGKDVVILEIGVFMGGSLQMWKNYFSTGNNKVTIYGIDIDPECKKLEEENIEIFIGSQEDRQFLRKIKQEIGKVDILIDDGGHKMNQQIVTLEELFDLVKEDGIYLCEDLHTSYYKAYDGGYKEKSFIEYSKDLIDYMHAQYSETDKLVRNKYSDEVKYITYTDSMIIIEKRKKAIKSIIL